MVQNTSFRIAKLVGILMYTTGACIAIYFTIQIEIKLLMLNLTISAVLWKIYSKHTRSEAGSTNLIALYLAEK